MVTRRNVLFGAAGTLGLAAASVGAWRVFGEKADAATGPIMHTDAEWRKLLTPAQYNVLRASATERPWTSPLLDEHREGSFVCAGCRNPVFNSKTKFESGTGWPSFWAPIEGHVGTREDRQLFITRTEVHCARCGGHLGHVFDDGPPPTNLRYCINGAALGFVPA